jgi:thiol-disulfide isomerase/thioredoxin
MLKRLISITAIVLLLIGLTVVPALALLSPGQEAPDFQLSDLSDNVHTLSGYSGKVVVIDFFENYCGYCQDDTKNDLIPLYNSYYKDNVNVQFLSVEMSGASASDIESVFLQATGPIPWPVLTNGGNLWSSYDIGSVPAVYVIDPAGNVAFASEYPIDVQTLKSTIDDLVAQLIQPTALSAASTATPAVNQNFTINGALTAGTTPIAGATIQLQKNVSGAWTNVTGKTNKTHSDGAYNITTSEPTAGTYQYRTTYAGTATYTSATSSVITVSVTKRSTTLTASTATPAVNQNFTINGTLKAGTTPIAGATIQLQKNVSGTWTNVTGKTNKTHSDGAYNITTSEPTTATYYYRTAYAGNDTYANATSNVVNVTVGAGAWSSWASLGGYITSSPTAVSWADGRIDTFVRGGDGALWQNTYANNAWSGWTSLGGQIAPNTSPAVSSQATGKLDLFVIGTDNALWHKSYANGAWSSWASLGGYITSSPTAVSWADGRIDTFVRGGDGALWQNTYANNAWSGWTSLGGQIVANTSPAVSSWGPGRLDVFVIGSDNALWQRSFA